MPRVWMLALAMLVAGPALAEVAVTVDASKEIGAVPRRLFGTGLRMNMESGDNVVSFLKETGITVFRYPDSVDGGYSWKWPQGLMVKDGKDGISELASLDGAIGFAKKVGAELVFTVRIQGGATAEEAAEVVRQAKSRGITGAYWSLGNEPYHDKQNWPREKYIETVKAFAPAIKAADPTARVGLAWGGLYVDQQSDKGRNGDILKATADLVDFAEFHCYPGRRQNDGDPFDPMKLAAGAQQMEREILHLKGIISQAAPAKAGKFELHVWEWHGAHTPLGDMHRLATAVYACDALGVMAKNGVKLACQYNMQEHWCGLIPGWAEAFPGGYATERWNGVTVRPVAYAMRLWSQHMGPRLLDCSVTGSGSFSNKDWHTLVNWQGEAPYVAAWATLSEKGDVLSLMLINKHPTDAMDVAVKLKGFSPAASAVRRELNGPDYASHNDNEGRNWHSATPAPELKVKLVESKLDGASESFKVKLPAHSVTQLELSRK